MSEFNLELKKTFADLNWLKRYCLFNGLCLTDSVNVDTKIKSLFSAAAWRLVCRSDSSAFYPLRRSLRFGLGDLIAYAESLTNHGFHVAPPGKVLSSFGFLNAASEIWKNDCQSKQAFHAMRLAISHGNFCPNDSHAVLIYLHHGYKINKGVTWATLVRRVHAWKTRQQALESQKNWDFACFATNWGIFEIVPLVSALDLWDEGQAMSNCLYSLRSECDSDKVSRFFSIRRGGKRYATFRLSYLASHQDGVGHRSYQLDECRHKANLTPHKDLIASIGKFSDFYHNLVQRQNLLALPKRIGAWRCVVDWGSMPNNKTRKSAST